VPQQTLGRVATAARLFPCPLRYIIPSYYSMPMETHREQTAPTRFRKHRRGIMARLTEIQAEIEDLRSDVRAALGTHATKSLTSQNDEDQPNECVQG
jgi:hypothetical protein